MKSASQSMATAMLCAAAVTAQFVSGKATRDALFLNTLDVTALPLMLIATSVFSILLVGGYSRLGRRLGPATLVPAAFVISGFIFIGEWLLRVSAPSPTAVLMYLHISTAGPLLASGFWLIAGERFDPRTAKRRFGQITGAGTLGGVLGALISERIATMWGAPFALLWLAGLNFVTAAFIRRLAYGIGPAATTSNSPEVSAPNNPPLRSGLCVIADAPHLRHLAALVLLGTTSAALLDYVFKVKAVETFGPGDSLLRFFAMYYAGTSLISFILQTLGSRAMLEKFGLALTTTTPSIALAAGSLGSLIAPGFGSLMVARGSESVFRASWFKAGYELFYTAMSPHEKRAAKSVIDVTVDRFGDAVGGGLVRLAILFAPAAQAATIVWMAIVSASAAIFVASRLNRWYVRTLERSLINQAGDMTLTSTGDGATARVVKSMRGRTSTAVDTDATTADPVYHDIVALRADSRKAAIRVLSRPEGPSAALVPHIIPLLAVDSIADYALFALRKVAEERVGGLLDALLDPNQHYSVRRRLARVFSVAVSQRAADGLLLALDDARFDVRFQAARSLAAIVERNPRIQIERERVYEIVLREAAVSRPVWESQRLLDGFISESPLDEFVRDRAGQSLAHVFTLLSLVLPREPLQIAFRSLHGEDARLRGTALEYLEEVLPARIRQPLWPFLLAPRRTNRPAPAHDQVIADLLRSSQSITLQNLAGAQK